MTANLMLSACVLVGKAQMWQALQPCWMELVNDGLPKTLTDAVFTKCKAEKQLR